MNKQIEEILTDFDFFKVHTAMEALKWTWYTHDGLMVPSIGQMLVVAKELLIEVYKDELPNSQIGTGGFEARKTTNEDGTILLELLFILEEGYLEYGVESKGKIASKTVFDEDYTAVQDLSL